MSNVSYRTLGCVRARSRSGGGDLRRRDPGTGARRGADPTPARLTQPHSAAGDGGHNLGCMRSVQITRFGGLEVMDVVALPDPVPGDGEQLFDISSSGANFADTHHRESSN